MENPQGVDTTEYTYTIPDKSFLKAMFKELTTQAKEKDGEDVFTLIPALRILMFFIDPDLSQLARHQHVDNVVGMLKSKDQEPIEVLSKKQLDKVIGQLLTAH